MSVSTLGKCLTLAAFTVGGLLGCTHNGIWAGPPQTPAARAETVTAAVEDIVAERCDLEARCGNLGPSQKYDRRDICESKLQGTTAVELNTKDCPLGVDHRKLEACLANIRAEACGSIFDSLGRWNACRDGQICYH